jgi:crossover junction endodeoxyribonuclease RuvC
MLVLGVDPGTNTGYGLVNETDKVLKTVKWGIISPSSRLSFPKRLQSIKEGLEGIISEFGPDVVAIEDIFYSKNVKTALKLGHMRGAAILAAAGQDVDVVEYAPLEVKSAIVGYGRADKTQVKEMVFRLLGLSQEKVGEHAADALAIAITHIHISSFNRMLEKS